MAYITIIAYFLDLIWPQGVYGGGSRGWIGGWVGSSWVSE